jgi:hypothetical protein
LTYLDDSCRPLREVLWVRGVGEDLLNGPVYLDALFDAYHADSLPQPLTEVGDALDHYVRPLPSSQGVF